MKGLSEFIRIARLKKGLSQDSMGAMLEMTQKGYSKIEREPEKAHFAVVLKVIKLLEIDWNNLQQN